MSVKLENELLVGLASLSSIVIKDNARNLIASAHRNHIFIRAIETVLVVILVVKLLEMGWLVYQDQYLPEIKPSRLQSSDTLPSNGVAGNRTFDNLQQFHLFGRVNIKKTASAAESTKDINDIPRSKLNIQLAGLLVHDKIDSALAIIAAGGEQQVYQIDEFIGKTKAKVVAIYPDRVIIEYQSRQEALLLYPDEQLKVIALFSGSGSDSQDESALPDIADTGSSPESLDEIISLSRVSKDGKLKGYRITPNRFPHLYRKSGFSEQDLVLSIDSYDLTDSYQAEELIEQLSDLEQIIVTVERGGQLHRIELSI